MKRIEEDRWSVSRRAEKFLRYMDETFPLEKSNGVPWHHCIDVSIMRIDHSPTCPIAQVVGVAGGDFVAACKYAHIEITREMQHAGLLPYNPWIDPQSPRKHAIAMKEAHWTIDYAAIEIEKLTVAIREKIEQRYREWPKVESA